MFGAYWPTIIEADNTKTPDLTAERDALRADLASTLRKYQAVANYIAHLREYLAEDAAALADLKEECESVDAWAGHYARLAQARREDNERLLAERNAWQERSGSFQVDNISLEKRVVALAAEVRRLTVKLAQKRENDADYAHLADEVIQLRRELAASRDLAREYAKRVNEAQAEVESLTADVAYWRQAASAADGKCGTLQTALNKAQADLTDLNAAWHADRAAYLRLDGAGPEYVTTDSDGRVTHYGRGRIVDMNAADDAPDSDERLSGAAERNEATGLTNRATDAALRCLQAHDAAMSAALGVTAHV